MPVFGGHQAQVCEGMCPDWGGVPLLLCPAQLSLPTACLPLTYGCRFAERHKRLLNAYVHRTPALLETSFAPLLRAPKLLDFDNKRVRCGTGPRCGALHALTCSSAA